MKPRTLDIDCVGYAVKTDVYEGQPDGPVMLVLIGRRSSRRKKHYIDFAERLAGQLGITTVIFDYSGHGDSPFDLEELSPAQHFLEVITVFDWVKKQYPGRKIIVCGSSYGGFLATQLTKYRDFDNLILRAPAIYRPSDFYTKNTNGDNKEVQLFRKDLEALSQHPLLARASAFRGKTLLVVHGEDTRIPKETTDAYRDAFNPDVIIAKGLPHSLDAVDKALVDAYFTNILDWVKKNI